MDDQSPRFNLKRLFIVTTVIAALLGCLVWLEHARSEADISAIRQAYINGRLTEQQARDVVGSRVDAWPRRNP